MTRRERIITDDTKKEMKKILEEIQNGKFKDEWVAEWEGGLVNLKKMEEEESRLQVEVVGKEIRDLFLKKERFR